uniref:Proteophosphoglycan ppg4 n=1 Tax=Mycena chlorophos TaxID=658473 RepID=A0ABQ0KY97_MYCCL|nr:predicted protein [Mycena chlorophos]
MSSDHLLSFLPPASYGALPLSTNTQRSRAEKSRLRCEVKRTDSPLLRITRLPAGSATFFALLKDEWLRRWMEDGERARLGPVTGENQGTRDACLPMSRGRCSGCFCMAHVRSAIDAAWRSATRVEEFKAREEPEEKQTRITRSQAVFTQNVVGLQQLRSKTRSGMVNQSAGFRVNPAYVEPARRQEARTKARSSDRRADNGRKRVDSQPWTPNHPVVQRDPSAKPPSPTTSLSTNSRPTPNRPKRLVTAEPAPSTDSTAAKSTESVASTPTLASPVDATRPALVPPRHDALEPAASIVAPEQAPLPPTLVLPPPVAGLARTTHLDSFPRLRSDSPDAESTPYKVSLLANGAGPSASRTPSTTTPFSFLANANEKTTASSWFSRSKVPEAALRLAKMHFSEHPSTGAAEPPFANHDAVRLGRPQPPPVDFGRLPVPFVPPEPVLSASREILSELPDEDDTLVAYSPPQRYIEDSRMSVPVLDEDPNDRTYEPSVFGKQDTAVERAVSGAREEAEGASSRRRQSKQPVVAPAVEQPVSDGEPDESDDGYGPGATDDDDELSFHESDSDEQLHRRSRSKKQKATTSKPKGKAPARSKPSVKSKGRKWKGKAAAPTPADSDDDNDEPDASDDGAERRRCHATGDVPQWAVDEGLEAFATFQASIVDIAECCNKTPDAIHQKIGTGYKLSRGKSAFNIYSMRHAIDDPKSDGESNADYNARVRADFLALLPDDWTDAQRSDSALVFKHLPDLEDWYINHSAAVVSVWREKGQLKRRAHKFLEPVLAMAKILELEFGLHLMGYVLDPDHEASFAWAGTDATKKIREKHDYMLNNNCKDMASMIRLGDRAPSAFSLQPVMGQPQTDKASRDVAREDFRKLLTAPIYAALSRADITSSSLQKFRIRWTVKFLEWCFRAQIRIINWPVGLATRGHVLGSSKCDIKKLNVGDWNEFLPGLKKSAGWENDPDVEAIPLPAVEVWTAKEKEQSLERQGRIPLIVDANGTVHRRLQHCPEYNAQVATGLRRSKSRAQTKAPPALDDESESDSDGRSTHAHVRRNPVKRQRVVSSNDEDNSDGSGDALPVEPASKRQRRELKAPPAASDGGSKDISTSLRPISRSTLPRMDFITKTITPAPTRERSAARPAPPAPVHRIPCRFDRLDSLIFFCNGFEAVEKPTRADRATLYRDPMTNNYVALPVGKTPRLEEEDQRVIYVQEMQAHKLRETDVQTRAVAII